MRNMNDNDLANIQRMAQNFQGPMPNPYSAQTQPQPKLNPSTSNSKESNPIKIESDKSRFPKIEAIKAKGNDFFKQGKFREAANSYLEVLFIKKAILDIEENKSIKNLMEDKDLKSLEIVCRLNYANAKSKLEDHEVSISQCQMVLKLEDNFKAYFRLGHSYYYMKKLALSLENLEKAKKMMPNDQLGFIFNFSYRFV